MCHRRNAWSRRRVASRYHHRSKTSAAIGLLRPDVLDHQLVVHDQGATHGDASCAKRLSTCGSSCVLHARAASLVASAAYTLCITESYHVSWEGGNDVELASRSKDTPNVRRARQRVSGLLADGRLVDRILNARRAHDPVSGTSGSGALSWGGVFPNISHRRNGARSVISAVTRGPNVELALGKRCVNPKRPGREKMLDTFWSRCANMRRAWVQRMSESIMSKTRVFVALTGRPAAFICTRPDSRAW